MTYFANNATEEGNCEICNCNPCQCFNRDEDFVDYNTEINDGLEEDDFESEEDYD
jgi:hypothetical protein